MQQKLASVTGSLRFALIAGDHTIFDMDHAMGMLCNVIFMRDQNNGIAFAMQLGEQRHDFTSGLANQGFRWAHRPG